MYYYLTPAVKVNSLRAFFCRKRKVYDKYTKNGMGSISGGKAVDEGKRMWIMWISWCITTFSVKMGIPVCGQFWWIVLWKNVENVDKSERNLCSCAIC